ncbi:hypothetical protein AAY473_018597 [Plecturocebus cupreus]
MVEEALMDMHRDKASNEQGLIHMLFVAENEVSLFLSAVFSSYEEKKEKTPDGESQTVGRFFETPLEFVLVVQSLVQTDNFHEAPVHVTVHSSVNNPMEGRADQIRKEMKMGTASVMGYINQSPFLLLLVLQAYSWGIGTYKSYDRKMGAVAHPCTPNTLEGQAIQEVEAGESLEPGRQRLQYAKITPLHSLGNKSETVSKKKPKTKKQDIARKMA